MRSRATAVFKTCSSKKFYKTQEEARRTASLRSHDVGFPLYTYSCRQCNGYHLTKQPPVYIEQQVSARVAVNRVEQRNYAENVVRYMVAAALQRKYT